MTITKTEGDFRDHFKQYSGSISDDRFNIIIPYSNTDELEVYVADNKLPDGTYTFSVDTATDEIVLSPALITAETVTIRRNTDLDQLTDYAQHDGFPADAHEDAIDKITMKLQELNDEILRTTKLSPLTTSTADLTLPEPVADKVIGWNNAADALENKTGGGGGGSSQWRLLGDITSSQSNIDGTIGFEDLQNWTKAIVTFTNGIAMQYDLDIVSDQGTLSFSVTPASAGASSTEVAISGAAVSGVKYARIDLTGVPVGTTEDIHVILS